MSTFLYRRGYWPEQAAVQEAALRASRELGDLAGEARAHLVIGHALTPVGRVEEAEETAGQVPTFDDALAVLPYGGSSVVCRTLRTVSGTSWSAPDGRRLGGG
ncbi:hypothetical protein [Micromonospora sp. NPDC003776]